MLEASSWFYAGGAILWVVLWWRADGLATIRYAPALVFPFLACLAVLFLNGVMIETADTIDNAAREESRFRFLDFRARLAITGLMSVLIVGGVLANLSTFSLSREFVRFQMLAVVFFLGFMAPVIWMPADDPRAMVILRHYQTVPFTFGLFLSIAGIIVLLTDLGKSPGMRSIRERSADGSSETDEPPERPGQR